MKEYIIHVHFFLPIDGKHDYYFGSLKAIYTRFTPEQIGCNVENLWSSSIEPDNPKATRNCLISKHEVVRCKQRK